MMVDSSTPQTQECETCNPGVVQMQLQTLAETLDKVAETVAAIDKRLRGNGEPGLISDVRELKTRLANHEKNHETTANDWKAILRPVASNLILIALTILGTLMSMQALGLIKR